jgi:hypothetical protein
MVVRQPASGGKMPVLLAYRAVVGLREHDWSRLVRVWFAQIEAGRIRRAPRMTPCGPWRLEFGASRSGTALAPSRDVRLRWERDALPAHRRSDLPAGRRVVIRTHRPALATAAPKRATIRSRSTAYDSNGTRSSSWRLTPHAPIFAAIWSGSIDRLVATPNLSLPGARRN